MAGNKNSGRRTKLEELGLPQLLAEIVPEVKRRALWRKLARMAQGGDVKAMELFLAYAYGKPDQKFKGQIESDNHLTIEIVRDNESLIAPPQFALLPEGNPDGGEAL
jgi:hypothetical protein